MLDVEKGRGAWRRGAGGEGGRPGRCRHPEQPGGSDRGDPGSSRDPVPRADGRAQAPGRHPVLRIGVHRWVVLGVPAAGGVRTAHLGAGLHPPTQMQWPPRSLHVLTAHLGAGSGGIGSAQPSHLGSRCAVPGSLTSWPKEGGQ